MATTTPAAPHDQHIDTMTETIKEHVKSESAKALTGISGWMKTQEVMMSSKVSPPIWSR